MVRGDDVAYAANWRAVLAADIGLAGVLTGSQLALWLWKGSGWFVATTVLSLFYLALVLRRALRWRRLRAGAGLGRSRPAPATGSTGGRPGSPKGRGSRGPNGRGSPRSGS